MHERKHALSNEEDHFDSSNDLDENMEELADDEQGKLFLQNNIGLLEDLMDNGLKTFV
jgi:hypothetical protein